MSPAQQQYFYLQQQQSQAAQLNSGFLHPQQNPSFISPLYSQQVLHGVPVLGLSRPAAVPQQFSVSPRGIPVQNGLQQHQWAQLRQESQAWGSGVVPSQQGLIQAPFVQQYAQHAQQYAQQQQQQQQQPIVYHQDIRSASPGINGVLPQVHGREGIHGSQQWAHILDGNGQFVGPPMRQESRRHPDGMRPVESSSHGNSHGNGSSQNKPRDNKKTSGNWSRGGSGGGPVNPRFKGGRNDTGRVGEPVRSQAVSLRCGACDRTFTNSQHFNAHNSTHVKCDEPGCSFEASGRVVKEHKQSTHEGSVSNMPARTKLSKSKESEEEVVKWREERKRHYPTSANVNRKAEEMKARKARGELVDEDAKKRRERLKEILARQAELGVPVAEVPAYYISDRYGALRGKSERGENSGSGRKDHPRNGKRRHDQGNVPDSVVKEENKERPPKVARTLDGSNAAGPKEYGSGSFEQLSKTVQETEMSIEGQGNHVNEVPEPDAMLTDERGSALRKAPSERLCSYFKRGWCKKGSRCEYLHERRPRKKKEASGHPAPKREPTLLAKLLEPDIRREKSHLLQSFRFFVNNMFLLEFPQKPLKFFNWQESDDGNSDGESDQLDKDALGSGKEEGDGQDDRKEEGSDPDEDLKPSMENKILTL